MHNGSEVSYAGLVICRQRPGTAAGVVFMTLEDETGFVNLVVWSKVFRQYRPTILTTSFLGVSGTIQSQHQVVHIIARQFWLPDLPATPRSPRRSPPARRPPEPPGPQPRLPLTIARYAVDWIRL